MSKQSAQNKQQTGSKQQQPEHQDALDMLANWIQMAQNLGMTVEPRFDPLRGRFTLRVSDVEFTEGQLVVAKTVVAK